MERSCLIRKNVKITKLISVLLVTSLLFLIACTNQTEKEETRDIGVALALSGFASVYGESEMKALELAKEEINDLGGINGKKVNFIVEDTQSDLSNTVTVFTKLIEVDKVKFIIGPTFTEFGEVASPVVESKKVLMIAPSSSGETEPFQSRYFIGLWPVERFEIKPLVEHMKANGQTKVAIFYNQNTWSLLVRDYFIDETNKRGIEVLSFGFEPSEKDFRTSLIKAKEKGFNVLYLPLLEFTRGEAMEQAKLLGFEEVYSTAATENYDLLNAYKEAMEGVIYPFPAQGPKEAAFTEAYEAKYGEKPFSPSAAIAYDELYLLKYALENGAETPEEVFDFMINIEDYEGASNMIDIDEYGMIKDKEFILKTIKNGEFIILE